MKLSTDFNYSPDFTDYFKNKIMENSESAEYQEAKNEWEITESWLNKKNKKQFLYKIVNQKTGAVLFPLEASTLRTLNVKELTNAIATYETLYHIKKKLESGQSIGYQDMNRATLNYLYYDCQLLKDNQYNQYHRQNDYAFITQLLIQDKEPTFKQELKFNMIFQTEFQKYIESLKITENVKIYDTAKEEPGE